MMNILNEIRRRNAILYYFGWIYFIGGILSIIMTQVSDTEVMGINAWIKPMKFFLSIWIFSWTMAWFLIYLNKQRAVRIYSWMVVVVMIIEQVIITWQAANGRLSHFNTTSPFYGALFTVMGVAIVTLNIWTGVIAYYFFRQKAFDAPMPYIWGIRLGIVLFVIFSFEGGLMAARLAHTVGAADGGPGLPLVNWSTAYGDLRVAHFIGIHSLQVLPLFGFYVSKTNRSVQVFSVVYLLFTAYLFAQALRQMPLF